MRFSIRNVTNADALNRYKEEEKTLLRNPALISMTASQEILKSCGNPLQERACASIKSWHICSMTVLFRCRVDPRLLKRAAKITEELGTSLPEAVRIFVAQIARTGSVPLSLSTKPEPEGLINKAARDKIMRSLDDTETW